LIEIEVASPNNEYYHPNLQWQHANTNIISITKTACLCIHSTKQCYECCNGDVDSQGCQQICKTCNQIIINKKGEGNSKEDNQDEHKINGCEQVMIKKKKYILVVNKMKIQQVVYSNVMNATKILKCLKDANIDKLKKNIGYVVH